MVQIAGTKHIFEPADVVEIDDVKEHVSTADSESTNLLCHLKSDVFQLFEEFINSIDHVRAELRV